MKVIKKINNNAAICLDSNDNELVALGTGIGFPKCPYELEDLSIVQRTYYDVDQMYYSFLNTIPEDVFSVAIAIVDLYNERSNESISSNVVFTLADHIYFAIEREKKNIRIDTPLQYEVQHLYELEYEVGLKGLKIIKKELGINFPKSEASNIALHFINAETVSSTKSVHGYFNTVIEDICNIVGKSTGYYIDKDSTNYSRFVSHLQYLLKREEHSKELSSDNTRLYNLISKEYPETNQCVLLIKDYLEDELNLKLNEEELLYLILHVNRLCTREDCYRKSITPNTK